jgi:predicted metal-dependent HD superfamily phosphohydrolase
MNTLSILSEKWFQLTNKYTNDVGLQKEIFDRLTRNYNSSERHYHNLSHIQKMLETLSIFENKLSNTDAVYFAVWFHDVVYNSKASDNEEQSASYATRELQKLNADLFLIKTVNDLILRTKNHTVIENDESTDLKMFLDTDLVILGSSREEYILYMDGVRKEYGHVPGILYRIGRKKIMKKFLEQKYIYRSLQFRERFEKTARGNIQFEIDQL